MRDGTPFWLLLPAFLLKLGGRDSYYLLEDSVKGCLRVKPRLQRYSQQRKMFIIGIIKLSLDLLYAVAVYKVIKVSTHVVI